MENQNYTYNPAPTEANGAIDTANSEISQFSDSRLAVAAIFAFLPSGIIGIHNFILKQHRKGLAHIVIAVTSFILFFMTSLSHVPDIIISMTPCLLVVSYIWSIVEGVQILILKSKN